MFNLIANKYNLIANKKIPKQKDGTPKLEFRPLLCISIFTYEGLARGVLVGLAAARSRSRSDSPPDCHSFRSRRSAT